MPNGIYYGKIILNISYHVKPLMYNNNKNNNNNNL